jgi:hypothetical protein
MSDDIRVHVVLELKPESVQAVVENAKRLVGRDGKGHYRVDTADLLGEMISAFLRERGFAEFVRDPANYPDPV